VEWKAGLYAEKEYTPGEVSTHLMGGAFEPLEDSMSGLIGYFAA